ncbi:MAG: protein translocase subunit SecD [Elusimicrobiaceae bacterium]
MPQKLMWKWILIFGLLILSAWLLYPSISWYTLPAAERTKLEAERSRPKRILNLGLDLRGGTYLLLELDVSKLDKKESTQDAMQRAIEIIRNRIDQYGVAETPITRQGDRWIAVQLPGIENTDQAEELIGKTAMLEFKEVDSSPQAEKVLTLLSESSAPFLADGQLNPEIAKELPAGDQVLRGEEAKYFVVHSTVIVTGASLSDAKVMTGGQYGMPYVSFTFNPEGGKIFGDYTGANIGKNLAIVLDNVVYSAPVIKSRIGGGSGMIEGGNFTIETAKRLAIVLRAGALPAPVRIIEKRTVGPGVGEDSIRAGLKASLLGLVAIVLFMMIYYKTSGFIADIALVLNFIFLLASMAYFSATLTLPGIAGMILSLAMAVDANVLILERIREEIHIGKPLALCIPVGYDKAWSAILDSNLTTWIAAVFLFQFGSGPVKGFAVTLTLGLLFGVFTSVFVTRAIYELWLHNNPKEMSI